MFPSRLVSLRGDIGWPARSPDLTPCDFFLWGYLKAEVYKQRPQTLKALKEAIREEGAAIPPEMTNIVVENFRKRLRQCIANNGRHLSDVTSKPNGEKTRLYVLFENIKPFSVTCFVRFFINL